MFVRRRLVLTISLMLVTLVRVVAQTPDQTDLPFKGIDVIPPDGLLTTPVGGLTHTQASSKVVHYQGQIAKDTLQVEVRKRAIESNATQLTIPITSPVAKGQAILASFWLRGKGESANAPARIEFLFERTVSPWTKSVTQGATGNLDSRNWKHILVSFVSSETYGLGEAMVSLRLATQVQQIEICGLTVRKFDPPVTLDSLRDYAANKDPLGNVSIKVNLAVTRQTMRGFGGDFCQPRYGSMEPMDRVGQYCLDHLNVVHARVGFPLNFWNPDVGEFRDDNQSHAALLALQILARRKIPTVLTIWEGPGWLLHGNPKEAGRVLEPRMYRKTIEAIVRFLKLAREKYGASVDYFSFNEPDYGVNFKFTPETMANFIRLAGPEFQKSGLKTKFIVGDTAGGVACHDFAQPLLQDPSIAPYLGPIGFHCWDGLTAADDSYASIAELGRTYNKDVWCLEAGWDSGLWQAPDPWAKWENALKTAMVYEKTIRLSGATLMDYWTYQDNYPLVDKATGKPFPVFSVIQQMEAVFRPESKVSLATSTDGDLQCLATAGPTKGRFGLLVINPKGPGSVTISGLPHDSTVLVTTSHATANGMAGVKMIVSTGGTLVIPIPTQAVVTLTSSGK